MREGVLPLRAGQVGSQGGQMAAEFAEASAEERVLDASTNSVGRIVSKGTHGYPPVSEPVLATALSKVCEAQFWNRTDLISHLNSFER